jgi:hypothetical protein
METPTSLGHLERINLYRWTVGFDEEALTQLGPLERPNFSHWINWDSTLLWAKTEPVSWKLYFYYLQFRTMGKVQKPSDSEDA